MSDAARQKRLFLVILIGFSLFFVVGYTSRLLKKNQMEQTVRQWQERIAQAEHKGLVLGTELAHVRSEAYIHERAREALGLVQPDDTLLVDVQRSPQAGKADNVLVMEPAPVRLVTSERLELANWQQWVALFLPTADVNKTTP